MATPPLQAGSSYQESCVDCGKMRDLNRKPDKIVDHLTKKYFSCADIYHIDSPCNVPNMHTQEERNFWQGNSRERPSPTPDYIGCSDPGCHAWRNLTAMKSGLKRVARNQNLFESDEKGHWFCTFVPGLKHANEGVPQEWSGDVIDYVIASGAFAASEYADGTKPFPGADESAEEESYAGEAESKGSEPEEVPVSVSESEKSISKDSDSEEVVHEKRRRIAADRDKGEVSPRKKPRIVRNSKPVEEIDPHFMTLTGGEEIKLPSCNKNFRARKGQAFSAQSMLTPEYIKELSKMESMAPPGILVDHDEILLQHERSFKMHFEKVSSLLNKIKLLSEKHATYRKELESLSQQKPALEHKLTALTADIERKRELISHNPDAPLTVKSIDKFLPPLKQQHQDISAKIAADVWRTPEEEIAYHVEHLTISAQSDYLTGVKSSLCITQEDLDEQERLSMMLAENKRNIEQVEAHIAKVKKALAPIAAREKSLLKEHARLGGMVKECAEAHKRLGRKAHRMEETPPKTVEMIKQEIARLKEKERLFTALTSTERIPMSRKKDEPEIRQPYPVQIEMISEALPTEEKVKTAQAQKAIKEAKKRLDKKLTKKPPPNKLDAIKVYLKEVDLLKDAHSAACIKPSHLEAHLEETYNDIKYLKERIRTMTAELPKIKEQIIALEIERVNVIRIEGESGGDGSVSL
jgi:chromosome segregation ATPase